MKDERIEPERKLADVTRPRIGIENLVQLLGVVARRLHDFPILKLEADAVESRALINARRIEKHVPLDRVLHRATEDLAVRNVAIAAADHRTDSFDAETQIGSRSLD